MKTCLSDGKKRQQEKMKVCNTEVAGKKGTNARPPSASACGSDRGAPPSTAALISAAGVPQGRTPRQFIQPRGNRGGDPIAGPAAGFITFHQSQRA